MADGGSDSDRIPSEEAPTVPGAVTSDTSEALSQASRRIGPYKLVGLLGEGGFGVVYLAEQQEPVRRRVALKIIKPGMDTKAVIARFEAERQALALMNHPNVARVFDAGTTEQGRPYFVMEHVAGVAITEHCDRHKLSIARRLDLFTEVCEAVQHAHQKGIIHRDIKPTNILVTIEDGKTVPKVIDFGVAKALSHPLTERTVFTAQGQLVGTPEYMSPEQAEMSAQDVDTRSDIYSLGVLLYELLTGTLPFDRESLRRAALAEIQRIIREDEPAKPSTKLSSMTTPGADTSVVARNRQADLRALTRMLRGDLDWITMKALEKDRTRRYTSASDLAADIARHLRHEPVIAGPPSAAYRIGKFVRRNRALVSTAAVVLAVLLLGVAGTTWGLVQAIEAREAEAQQRELAEARQLEAERQATIALELNNFLNHDLLGAVSPEQRGRDVSMRELLDAASDKIEGRFEVEPLVEAAIRTTLGNTYRSLGEYEAGEPHLKKALELCRAERGEQHLDTLDSMNNLALLYWNWGRYDEAESLYVEALEISRRVLGEEHPDTLASVNNLATLYYSLGRYDEAEPLLVRTLETTRRALGEEHRDTLNSMNNLATLRERQGRADEAERLYVKTLEISRRVLGEEDLDTLRCMNNLGRLYYSQGRHDEAEALAVKRLEISRRKLGEDHPDTLVAMNNLALLYRDRGRHDEAEPLFVKTLEISRRVLGEEHPETLRCTSNLGLLYHDLGRYDEAEPLFVRALEISRHVLGERHPDTLLFMSHLGDVYSSLARYEEAEQLLGAAVQGARQVLPHGHPVTGASLRKYGVCLTGLERYDEAEEVLLEAYNTLLAALGPTSAQTLEATGALVHLYDAWGKPEKAAEWRAKLPAEAAERRNDEATEGSELPTQPTP